MEKKILKILGFVALYSVVVLLFLEFYVSSDLLSGQHDLTLNFTEQVHQNVGASSFIKREYFFNYSKQELDILNKYQTTQKCSYSSNDLILFSENKFQVNCQNGKLPAFLFGDEKTILSSGTKTYLKWDSLQHKNSFSEFVFIKCSQNRFYSFVKNLYNKDHEDFAKNLRDNFKMDSKNLNILVLSLESLSRNAAFRHLPKFLSLFQNSKYNFYNFTHYSKSSSTFEENYFKTVYGNTYKVLLKGVDPKKNSVIEKINKEKDEYCPKSLEKIAIWSIFNKLGFVTMYLNDKLNLFHSLHDEDYSANHVLVNFWKAEKAINDETHLHEKSNHKQKCFGNRTNYDISFDYTTQFFKNYRKSNKFSLVHISRSQTSEFNYEDFDSSLSTFIKALLSGKHPNLVLFFISHQGERFPEFSFDLRGFYESVNPLFFLIADKKLVDDLGSEKILRDNSDKLLTGGDVYKTLMDLANYPFDDAHKMDIHPYMKNLFTEKINEKRNCKDAGAHIESCLNNDFSLLNLKNEKEAEIVNELILMIKTLSQTLSSKNKNCKELGQVRVNLAEKINLVNKVTYTRSLYKISAYDDWHKNFTIIGFLTEDTKDNLTNSIIIKEFQDTKIGIQAVKGLESCIKPN